MRGSGVTAARSCLQPLVSASRYLAVHALPGDPLYFVVEAKSRVKEVYAQTCVLLGQQGMRDCELFGLAILSDGEYLFVDPESKLSKYAPKNWRSSHTYGLDSSGRPAFVLYFRVRYYVDTPLLLSDETTRHHYYLQLRDNVVRHGGGVESLHPHHPFHAPSIVTPLLVLAGLALQADLGNYSEERHSRPHAGSVGYCKPTDYLPSHMCLEGNVLGVLSAQHRDNRDLSREEAELQYIREAVLLEAPLNAHLYRLRRSKSEAGPGRILLAICARGVRIYAEEETPRVFAWNNIGKLCFDRKKFEIRAVDQPDKLTLFSGCDDKSKLLLGLCRDTHQFSMAIAPRLSEARRREEEERKVLRDCYMYPARCKLSLAARGARGDQRISVISSTSSNTTSGIVSDRVHSEDEPDTAPVSTECLPRLTETTGRHLQFAQVLHNGDNSEDLSRSSSPAVSTVDEVDGAETVPPSTVALLRLTSGAGTTGAEGSQCSSSCSTVVIASAPTGTVGGTAQMMRRPSATSSIELGYSHTAQNSAVSITETASFPGVIYDRCKKTGKYAGTDIASETSGVYTLRSSEMLDERITDLYSPSGDANESSAASDVCAVSSVQSTTDEASVTSGFYTIHSGLHSESSDVYTEDVNGEDQEPMYSVCKGDDDDVRNAAAGICSEVSHGQQLDDPRSRSNSILSAGSFRGDGSDPSDVGPLLSADELSDLIVGRYPPRKTISTSMDSDCDYVTMPPPPPPPPPPPQPPPRTDASERQLPPPPPYPVNVDYATIKSPRGKEREPPPPPPPYNALRGDFVPLPPRRTEPPPPPPPYTSPRERIQIPPPTPPRNDAVTPREPPPPPPPYPVVPSDRRQPISSPPPPLSSSSSSNLYQSTSVEDLISTKLIPASKARTNLVTSKNKHGRVANPTDDVFPPALPPPYVVAPKPPPRIQPPTYPGDKMKPTPVHAPVAALVVGPNNYLDVHASRGGPPVLLPYLAPPPPPTAHPRQSPPPPPSLATVYTSQVARSQIEQYKQQLYSDVDYVMFPLKDPAISKQEYIDAKQGSFLAAMATAYPPPPYPAYSGKSSLVYRSTPYLPAATASFYPSPTITATAKYASNQNLSTCDNYPTHGNPSNSHCFTNTNSLYNGAACSPNGSRSLRREPPLPVQSHTLHAVSRTRSDENILSSLVDSSHVGAKMQSLSMQPKHRRLPPPPPPPAYEIQTLDKSQPLPSSPPPVTAPKTIEMSAGSSTYNRRENGMLDIRTLREKSRNLDLPLISALCNDRYLLKQTKAFVLPKHPSESIVSPSSSTSSPSSSFVSSKNTSRSGGSTSSRNKYPVSGLSTTQISKPPRKSSHSTHRHPTEVKGNATKASSMTTTTTTTTTTATTTTTTVTTTSSVPASSSPSTKKDLTRTSRS